jgi:AAHS family 4-hydroxybenzoate transporter-like MFS transporter
MRGRNSELASLPARLRPEREGLYAAAQFASANWQRNVPVRLLLAPRYRRTTLAMWASACLSLFAIFGLTTWLPSVRISRGESFGSSFAFAALVQIMSFFGGIACAAITDRGDGDYSASADCARLGLPRSTRTRQISS